MTGEPPMMPDFQLDVTGSPVIRSTAWLGVRSNVKRFLKIVVVTIAVLCEIKRVKGKPQ